MWRSRSGILALGLLTPAASVFAQGNPAGTISGHVTDPDSLALPGVAVTAASPVLQGMRTAVTSVNGDDIIPFLPALPVETTEFRCRLCVHVCCRS